MQQSHLKCLEGKNIKNDYLGWENMIFKNLHNSRVFFVLSLYTILKTCRCLSNVSLCFQVQKASAPEPREAHGGGGLLRADRQDPAVQSFGPLGNTIPGITGFDPQGHSWLSRKTSKRHSHHHPGAPRVSKAIKSRSEANQPPRWLTKFADWR